MIRMIDASTGTTKFKIQCIELQNLTQNKGLFLLPFKNENKYFFPLRGWFLETGHHGLSTPDCPTSYVAYILFFFPNLDFDT